VLGKALAKRKEAKAEPNVPAAPSGPSNP
jgi:hypothetical protein